MCIGDAIKKARQEKGMTQSELAQKVGVSSVRISQYETKARKPKFAMLKKISDALETPIWMLCNESPLDPDVEKALWRYRKDGKWVFPGLVDGNKAEEVFLKENLLCNFEKLNEQEQERANVVLYRFGKLNEQGQNKAVDNIVDLTKIPEYQKNDQKDN